MYIIMLPGDFWCKFSWIKSRDTYMCIYSIQFITPLVF